MPSGQQLTSARSGAPIRVGSLWRLALAALSARYHLDRQAGALFLLSAALDPFVYAGVIYFVIVGVFERSGFDRYFFLLIGLISFRWTVTCILDGANFAELRARMREVSRHPTISALLIVVAAPSVVMVLSILATVAVTAFIQPAGWKIGAWPWLALVIAVQGVWNLVAVLAINRFRAQRSFMAERVVMIVAGLMWLLSPVVYRFRDIPDAASLIFTTFNPVSHVLAGYYNALWFGRSISLDVLPVAALIGGLLLLVVRRRLDMPSVARQTVDLPRVSGQPLLVLVDPAFRKLGQTLVMPDGARRFRRWYGRVRSFSGRDLVRLIASAGGKADASTAVEQVRAVSGLDRLYDDHVSLYSDRALSQLAFASAIENQGSALLLDGVLDGADRVFIGQAWTRLNELAREGRPIVVVSYDLLAVPATAAGAFVAVTQGRIIRSGRFGTELTAFYDQVMRDGAFPPHDGA